MKPETRNAPPPAPRLLVSVRNAAEASAALGGGADVIDVKDPAAGSLGRAVPETLAAVLAAVAGRRPVSAALGELTDPVSPDAPPPGLAFVKLGLAHAPADWPQQLAGRLDALDRRRFVAAAYADHARAAAPPIETVLDWAITHRVAGLLIDTAIKDGRGLLHWCDPDDLRRIARTARRHGLFLALAGSLTAADLPRCLALEPDLIAVRTAACADLDRNAPIDADRVRRLKHLCAAAAVSG